MTGPVAQAVPQIRPPKSIGRWVSAYRAIWWVLALGGAGLLIASLFHPVAHPAILALRLAKGMVLISVSAILLRRRKNDPVAALLSLAFLTWTISSSVDFASADMLVMLLDRGRFLLFVLALLLFPDGGWRPNWTRMVAVASGVVFILGVFEAVGIAPTHLFLPFAVACVIAAVIALFSRFRTAASEAVRLQLKWVALGLVSGIGLILLARAGSALSAVSPLLPANPILWETMFQLGIVLLALGFLVSLLRYRLFDVETAVSRSAAYGGLTLALLATFAASEAVIEILGQTYFGMSIGNAAAAIAAAIAAVLLTPLHHRINHWAEQHFHHDLVALKVELPELLDELSAKLSPGQLGAAVLPRISGALHAARAVLVIKGSVVAVHRIGPREAQVWLGGWDSNCLRSIDRDSADAVFPVRVPMCSPSGRSRAWLLLGPRPDGSLFGKDEIKAIVAIVPAFRRALAAISERDAERARARRLGYVPLARIRDLSARLDELESVVAVRQKAVDQGTTLLGPNRTSA